MYVVGTLRLWPPYYAIISISSARGEAKEFPDASLFHSFAAGSSVLSTCKSATTYTHSLDYKTSVLRTYKLRRGFVVLYTYLHLQSGPNAGRTNAFHSYRLDVYMYVPWMPNSVVRPPARQLSPHCANMTHLQLLSCGRPRGHNQPEANGRGRTAPDRNVYARTRNKGRIHKGRVISLRFRLTIKSCWSCPAWPLSHPMCSREEEAHDVTL